MREPESNTHIMSTDSLKIDKNNIKNTKEKKNAEEKISGGQKGSL
jgi:hypothetical protein